MSLRHAILAMLDLEEGTGYDLVKRFNQSIGHFWSSTHQQVYKELHKLNDEGLVSFESVVQQGKPDKKVYSVTRDGLAALREWVRQPAKPFKVKEPLLVKLFAGRHGDTAELLAELSRHENMHQETARQYAEMEQQFNQQPADLKKRYLLPYMTLRLGIHFEQAWMSWLREVREALSDQDAAEKDVHGREKP